MKKMTDSENSSLLLYALLIPVQLFIFTPSVLYFLNVDEMGISFFEMLKLNLVPTVLLWVMFLITGSFFQGKLKNSFLVAVSISSIVIWVQGNVILWEYGLLDGRLIHWNEYTWRGWIDLSVWLGFVGVVFISRHVVGKFVIKAAVAIFILQFLTVTSLLFQNSSTVDFFKTSEEKNLDSIYQFSSKSNVLHLMLDGFQSDVFNDLINAPVLGEYYKSKFSGFTYYKEAMSAFPYTRFSVPAFLSGKLYSNEMKQDDFVDKILAGKNIINAVADAGYEVDVVAGGSYLAKRYLQLKPANLINLDNMSSPLESTAKLIDLSLFRAAPHFLKPYIYNDEKWLVSRWFAPKGGMQFPYFQHTFFMNKWINTLTVQRNVPVYKYIHIMNTHNPMVVNPDCSYAGKVTSMDRESLTSQAKCTVDTVVRLFEKMKALGIYDNTLIVVHGDHGGWVENHRQNNTVRFPDGEIAPGWVASLASPLLAIKLPRAHGDLQVSDQWVSLLELPDTISDVMKLNVDFGYKSIYKQDNGASKERYFRFYGWSENEWSRDYAQPIQEYIIKGSHYDTDWELGRIFFPADK